MPSAPPCIHESPAADAGQNGRSLNLPSERAAAIVWLVQRISKLSNERANTASIMTEARKAAVNDGYSSETLGAAIRLGKMSPEQRERHREKLTKAFALYGLEITTLTEDPKPDRLLNSHLQKLRMLAGERKSLSVEITETYAAAKDHGIDVPALKQIIKLARMAHEDRGEWFARLDNLGAVLNYW